MIELPPKFKQALGNGVRTSLYPLVRIYKGVRIDDPEGNNGIAWEDAEQVYLSCKETNIGGSAYKPLLLNTPSIKSSADIVNNKYTISSVSLSISNAPFQGKIFSDDIQSILNAVCQVYYCANGIDSIEDCLLVYTGTIRRFSQSAETIKLELEDATQQILSTKIPISLVEGEENYKEDDIGKPYPMVYGYVDKSPLIKRSLGTDNMGQLREQLTEFHIDKKGTEIQGLWESPNYEQYGNSHLNDNHPLILYNYLQSTGSLSVYSNNFVPISQKMDIEGWSFYVGGITDEEDNDYNKIEFSLDELVYDFQQADGNSLTGSPASIKINADALIDTDSHSGIPTRVYRPLDKVECFTFCDNDQGDDLDAINRIFGFANYDITSVGVWKPWEIEDNIFGRVGYERDWDVGGTTSWWEPTACNENVNGGVTSAIDERWKDAEWKNSRGFFPVDNLQDGGTDKGIYVCGRNADGTRNSGQNKCGMAAVKLVLKDNIGSFPCSSKIVYDGEYHSFDDMHETGQNKKRPIAASFWTGESIPVYDSHGFFYAQQSALSNIEFPYMPDSEFEDDDFYDAYQVDTEDTVRKLNVFRESKTFNNTTAFDNFKFGIEQYGRQGDTHGNDNSYVSALLFNIYLLQDAIIEQPLDKDFFADVAGRMENDEVIVSAQNILKDILEDELNYQPNNIELIDEIDSWQHSFTLNEQKEAKEVFEGLFKSSLIIPSFNAQGQFSFIPLHQVLDNVSYTTIDNQDLLKYSFSLTKLDDIKNSVNVKYKKNYGSGEFDKETGYSLIDADGNEYENLDEITRHIHLMFEHKYYNIDYYGLTSEEAKLEVETDYIRDDDTARKLQKRLLMWYANQHLIAKIDLPATYMNLEVGDYIGFNELVGGKKAFGFDYTISQMKNGQIVYPVFFITKISKSLDKVNIEAIQVHRGDYGEPDEDIIIDEENIVDGGGNSGQGNWELGDPNDNPNYGEDTIVEEEAEEEYTEDPYLNVTWVGGNNDLNTNPQAIIDTNIEGEFEYETLIIYNDEIFEYGTNYEMPIITEDDEPYNATDYINVNTYTNTNSEGNIQGGNITLSTPYLIPEEHNGIVGILRISYEGTEYSFEVDFAQGYVVPPVYELGDINGDGIIDILDMVRLVQIILETADEPSDDELSRADINQDGIVNIGDIISLVQLLLTEGGEVEEQPT